MELPLNKISVLSKQKRELIISSWDNLSNIAQSMIIELLDEYTVYENTAIKEALKGDKDFDNKLKQKLKTQKYKAIKLMESDSKEKNLNSLIDNI